MTEHANSISQEAGTAVITQGDMALQVIKTGYDDKQMGKWS